MVRVLNFGSLNIDMVYQVPHFILPGETLACTAFSRNAGGKGLNQSIALAKAGISVLHAGKIGLDGQFLLDLLQEYGVNTDQVIVGQDPTGQAIIEVEAESGSNRILLFPGANTKISDAEITNTISHTAECMTGQGRYLLLQNEINSLPLIMDKAFDAGFQIVFNPSPFTPEILNYPLEKVTLFFVNEIEAAGLAGMPLDTDPMILAEKLVSLFPNGKFVMTLGSRGAMFMEKGLSKPYFIAAEKVQAVDTTAAGDTFTGYFLAHYLAHPSEPDKALFYGNKAAAISVTIAGAAKSIPVAEKVFCE